MPEHRPPASPSARDAARERRHTLAWLGAAVLGAGFGTGYLPAVRDVRTLQTAEDELRDEIRLLRGVTDRLRREVEAARHDPLYAEAVQRAQSGGRLPGESACAGGWRVPPAGGGERSGPPLAAGRP